MDHDSSDLRLRAALHAGGQRFTEQRATIYRYLAATHAHPTADEVFSAVRRDLPNISLATVYKSLETLVGCGLAVKLNYADASARYDGRTDLHHHARCVVCDCVVDIPGEIPEAQVEAVRGRVVGFAVTGYRLEFSGYCASCLPRGSGAPLRA